MSIRTGVSCVTIRDGNPTKECLVAEIRNVAEDPQREFWKDVDYCLANNIYAIINIDLWSNHGHLEYTELTWRQRVDGIVYEMLQKEPTAKKWRMTIDNEPMKYISKEKYAWYVNIAYDQIKVARGWTYVQLGAGNEEFSLASARGNMYEYILQNCQFDYLDIHIQAAVIDPPTMRVSDEALNYWGAVAKGWATKYKKKLSCTEGNWCNVAKETGYTDLIKMINKAEEIGCEDFCIVFTDYRTDEYCWLSFLVKGVSRSQYWDDMKKVILAKKPTIIEEDDMKLDPIYKRGSKGIGVKFIQKCMNANLDIDLDKKLLVDGIFGGKTEEAVKLYQKEYNMLETGIVERKMMKVLIFNEPDVWNEIEYDWSIGVR